MSATTGASSPTVASRVGLARPAPASGATAILLAKILPQPLAVGLVHARLRRRRERPGSECEHGEGERHAPAMHRSVWLPIHGGILGPGSGERNAPAGKRCNNR